MELFILIVLIIIAAIGGTIAGRLKKIIEILKDQDNKK